MTPDRMWLDDSLQPVDLKLWLCLCFFARDRDQLTQTDADLASKVKASQQTVRRSLQRLEAAQFIERSMEGRTRIITLKPEGDGKPIAEYALKVMAG
jgi:DNA-binding MarR family transcriptional regulator